MGAPPKAPIFILSHNPIQNLLNAKSIFIHQSIKATISPKRRDMPSVKALKNYKIVNEVNIFWRFVAVGNGILWLTPCKRMKLRRSE